MALSSRVQTYVLTLTGSPQVLQDLLAGNGQIRWAELTAMSTNTNPVYHAGTLVSGGVLSATNYGGYIPAPTSSVPAAPYRMAARRGRLDDWQVLGTVGEKLCITARVDV